MHWRYLMTESKGWRWPWEEAMCSCYVPLEWTPYAYHPCVARAVFSHPSGMGLLLLGNLMETGRTLPVWWLCVWECLITHPSETRQWGPSHWPSPVQGAAVCRDGFALQSNFKIAGTWQLLGLLPKAVCVWDVTTLFSMDSSSLLSSPWRFMAWGTGCTQAVVAAGGTDNGTAPSFWQVVSWW